MAIYSDNQPHKLEAVGNGSYLYHYGIEEVDRPAQEGEETTGKQWQYEEVTVWAPLSANKITQKVLTSRWDSDYEQKLVNEYNSAQMGLLSEEEAAKKIEAYKAFLMERSALKAQVDSDCEELGIN